MPLSPGTRLGPYEVVSPIGAGGMGEVYRGRDTRLHRDIAIKVLAARAAGDDLAVARFEREARAIAALNHPNVCAIYDVGEQDGHEFLIMELLEGETLHRRLARGPLDAGTFLDHALALTDGLEAAHARGLIHRDLKPANIFLTTRDHVKILDFGLVKHVVSFDTVTRAADAQLTDPAMGLGTLSYMSPEQLRGEPLDARTDIFSLGLVLYEMATGGRAFGGSTDAVISAAILNREPRPPRELCPDLPARAEDVILKALEKDRDLRYQTVTELRTDLKRLRRQSSDQGHAKAPAASAIPTPPSPETSPAASSDAQVITGLLRRHRLASVLFLAIVIGGVWGAIVLSRRAAPARAVGSDAFPHLQVQRLTLTGDITSGAISPDGRFVAYVRKNAGVWVRQISAENDIQVVPFVKDRTYDSVTLTPDGNSVDFAVGEGQTRDLWRVPLLGGTPRRVVKDIWSAPGWSPDGRRMAFLRTKGPTGPTSVIDVDQDGANERVLATRRPPADLANSSWGPLEANRPSWSPDGKSLLLVGSKGPDATRELVVVDTIAAREVRATPVKKGTFLLSAAWLDEGRVLLSGAANGAHLPALWAGDFNSDAWTPLTREFTAFAGISVTADRRTAVATRTERRSGIWLGTLTDEQGTIVVAETAAGASSPVVDDRGGILYQAYAGYGVSMLHRLAPGALKPVVLGEYRYGGGFVTSPDGQFAVFNGGSDDALYRINSDGTGRVALVDRNAGGPALTPDGKSVLFSPYGASGLYSVPISGGPVRELSKLFVGSAPSVSPDGRRLLFASARPGIVILCDLPGCTNARELELRSFQWAPDGQGVTYINEQDHRNLWEQHLDGRPPRALTHFADAQILEFGWSPDGKRLVLARGHIADDMVLLKGLR